VLRRAALFQALRAPLGRLTVLLTVFLSLCGTVRLQAATAGQVRAGYSDEESGFAVTAPAGWRLAGSDEVFLPQVARAGFLGPRHGVLVYVVVELIPGGLIPRGETALANYFASYMVTGPYETVRSAPVAVTLAGRRGLRAAMSIATGQGELVKTLTAVREGFFYFVGLRFERRGSGGRRPWSPVTGPRASSPRTPGPTGAWP